MSRRTAKSSNLTMLAKQPLLLACILFIFAILLIFILLPLFNVFKLGFSNEAGGFSIANFVKVIGNSSYRRTFFNSIKLGVLVAVIATTMGYIFAFAMTRTEMPGKKFFRLIATLPIISPPFVLSLSLIFLFGRLGLISNQLLGIENADVYGLRSLVIVQAISFFPVAYMTLTGILESIDDSVEDAAYSMGSSRWHIFRTVTLPLSFPGIASALLLVFIQSLEDFSNPAVIAGGYSTLAVEAYRVITGMNDMRGGCVLAIILLLPTLLAFTIQKFWIAKKSFVTVTGKPTQKRRKLHEPHIVWPLFAFCALISGLVILLYGTVLVGAFVKTWGINYSFTLDHFKYVFSLGWLPMRNSLTLAGLSAPLAGILGMAIAFLVVRQKFPGKRIMEFSSVLTFAVPGTVLGIGYIYSFNSAPLLLTGTGFILVMAFTFRNMPVGIESGTATLLQIDSSIEEASTILGASAGYTFRRITLPLLQQAFASGLVYSFVRAMTAVSSVIFLISPRWNLATTRVFSLFEVSQYSDAAAYIFVMIFIIVIVIGIINLIVDLLFKPKHLRVAEKSARQMKRRKRG
ncbi:MAG: ABC transporter permease [Lachnospiraceae bacterium]